MSMFGALNRFISRLDDAPRPRTAGEDGSFGFQVLRNKDDSVPIEPWFDFIIGINGRPIENPDPNLFANEVRNLAGQSVGLTLWNAKGQRVRQIYLPVPSPTPTLSLTLQWTPLSTAQSVWHILEVAPNSPADDAGLLPYGDYIIGSPEGLVHGEGGLGELVEEYLARPLRLFVYNHEYNVTRTLTLTPSRSWGGEGALGCVLGYGHLHQIPAPLEEGPPVGVGETMFENVAATSLPAPGRTTPPPAGAGGGHGDDLSHFAMSPPKGEMGEFAPAPAPASGGVNMLTPANLAVPPPMMATGAPPKSAGGARGKKAKGARKGGFDDLFAEGEKKSAELDNAPTKKTGAAPPPPKAGGISRTGTPGSLRPETRSPDPITGESDDASNE